MIRMFSLLLCSALLALSIGCQDNSSRNNPLPDSPDDDKNTGNRVSLMAYNLENLFDDVQNSAVANETITPSDVLEKKLSQVASGILQISGIGPDVLFVSEVENSNVLHMLNDGYLQTAKYQTVALLDAEDERGIDVGVLARFPLAGAMILHRMPFADVNPTRGILEVPLTLDNGKILRVFAVHFPSQANPVDQRRQAAEYLKKLMLSVKADEFAIAAGDFNITTKEEDKEHIFRDVFAGLQISNEIGCKKCPGTYNYKGEWSFYDVIISREPNLIAKSVRTPNNAPTQVNADGSPRRFDKQTGEGISDHLPIFSEAILN